MSKKVDSVPWFLIGDKMRNSIHRNFIEGGRPGRWVPRKKSYPWPPLRKTDHLSMAHRVEVGDDEVTVSNKVPYQAVHNFGYPQSGIPQREYSMFQEGEPQEYSQIIIKHILS